MFTTKAKGNNGNNPNWNQITNGPFCEEYCEAICHKIQALNKMKAWEVVERKVNMNVLSSTWAFKCNQISDGLIKKSEARFCARGDQ